jgi:hypothetical protein
MRVLPSPTATPLATALVIVLLGCTGLLDLAPGDAPAIVNWASTNVHNLAQHPIAAMIASAFIVPGLPSVQIVIVGVACAALERRVGTRRTMLIALSGQVFATLLTEYGAELGASLHLWAASPADRPDVGVSYVMFSVLAASWLLLEGRARVVGIAATGGWASIMFLTSPGMTSTGHLLCIAFGLATMRLVGGTAHRPLRLLAPQIARMTSRRRGPWTPSTRFSSMSLVALGPLIHVNGRDGSSAAMASGTERTICSELTTTR